MNTRLNDVKIKTRLIAICLILVTIPVLVLGFASYNATKSGINEQSSVLLQQEALLAKAQVESNYDMIQQKLESDLQVARSHYQEHLEYADRRTQRVAVHPDVISSFNDPGSLHSVLAGIAKNEGFNILTVTDTKGTVIARASSTKTGDTFVPDLVRKGTIGGFAATEIIDSQYLANEGLSGKVGVGKEGMALTSVYPVVVDGATVGAVVGGYILNYNYEIVDSVQSIIGGTATIFQDNLRISTNVLNEEGDRAVGTTVSSTVYDTVVNGGGAFYGKAWVVNADYQTAYEPIKNSDGKAIGILYVGVKQVEFQDDMMNSLAEVVIGKTGYVYLLDTDGNYVLSSGRQRDGDNIWNAKDASGAYFIQEICNKGKALTGDETFVQDYMWQNSGENEARLKLAAIAYSPEFDWVIGASCYDNDFADPVTKVRNVTIIVCIIAIIAGALVAYFFANSITNPLNEVMIGANRIRDGDFGYDIQVDSKDELGDLARTFGDMKGTLQAMVGDVNMLAQAGIDGKLDVRADASKHGGDFGMLVQGVNGTLDAVIGPLNVAAEYVDRISKGDIPMRIVDEYKGDFNEIKNNLNALIGGVGEVTRISQEIAAGNLAVTVEKRSEQDDLMKSMATMVDSIKALRDDVDMLAVAGVAGKLDVRADATKHGGDFQKIIVGVNETLDAVIGPMNVAAEYMDRISKGDIPEPITEVYKGDFNEIKNNLNVCISAISGIVAEMGMLSQSAVDGKLNVRGDASRFGGDFGQIVIGVNDTVDALAGPLKVAVGAVNDIGEGTVPETLNLDEFNGDVRLMAEQVNNVSETMRNLLDETNALVESAVSGRLGERADASKFAGGWNDLIGGVNSTVDTLVGHIDAIPAPAMLIDEDFNINFMSKAGADMVGLSQEQLIGQKCYDHFKTDDCRTANCACARAMSSGVAETRETDAHPGGEGLSIAYTGVPVRNQAGKTIGALEVVMDQTEIKRAMDDASEKVAYLNNVPTPVMVINKDMDVQYMNPAGAAAVGMTPETCVGQKCFSLFNTEHCNTPECRTARAMKEDGVFTSDTMAHASGTDLPIRYTGAPIKDAAGNIIGGLEYVNDITEENQAVAEVGRLVEAAVAGNLDARGDPDNYDIAGFKNIVQGINDTMDAVVEPVKEVVRIVTAYAEGRLDARVELDARGEFERLGETLNQFGDDLQAIVAEAGRLAGLAADGDLTAEVEIEVKGDYNSMLNSVNALIGVLSDTITSTRGVGERVLGTAQGLSSAAQEMNAGMEQLASASQQVAEGSQRLAELAQNASRDIAEVASQVEQTSVNASESAEKGDEAVRISNEVQDAASQTLEGLTNIQEGVSKTSETVGEMNTAIEKVGSMGEVITDVADQTNMLGLNAAIEAARAGEAGKGFAVVADAVKNLAEKVKDAAAESAVAVERIQESGENAITVTETAVDESVKGGELLHVALDGVDRVTEALGGVNTMIQEIDSGAKSATDIVKTVVANIDEVASVSEESASASEESSSAVQEQTSAIQELTAEAQGLSDIAQMLMNDLNKFKTRDITAA